MGMVDDTIQLIMNSFNKRQETYFYKMPGGGMANRGLAILVCDELNGNCGFYRADATDSKIDSTFKNADYILFQKGFYIIIYVCTDKVEFYVRKSISDLPSNDKRIR